MGDSHNLWINVLILDKKRSTIEEFLGWTRIYEGVTSLITSNFYATTAEL